MAGRKLVRDLLLSKQHHILQHSPTFLQETSATRLRLILAHGSSSYRQFSVFNEFSNKIKGEVNKNQEFQKSVKELKERAEELKGVKEDLKVRTKQTTEQLYKQVDGVWTEAEATAKKVSANVKEKISAATEEVKETLGIGKQESTKSSGASPDSDPNAKDETKAAPGEDANEQSTLNDSADTIFGKIKETLASASPSVSMAFQKIKETKVIDVAKKGYNMVKDEITGNTRMRKHIQGEAAPKSKVERSTRTEVVIVPTKQSRWSRKWDTLKGKIQSHPIFRRATKLSGPVVVKGREIVEDVQERWETSDHPVVHKIQDLNDTVFGETSAAESFKEMRRRDPSFSLPDFLNEVQEIVKPVLNAYIKGDTVTLKKYCSPEVIQRCQLEHGAFQSQGIFFENKILHISDAEIRETKMMGTTPIIIVAFQTQQVYCVRDRNGAITEGSKDTIHTVYYMWAMQQIDPEELGEGAIYPVWRLREMQQIGVQTLI